jgi:hypothetical protein
MNAASAIATKMAITVSFMLIDADVVPNFTQTAKKYTAFREICPERPTSFFVST